MSKFFIIKVDNKGKTKRAVLKKYIKQSTENKYRESYRSYTIQKI